MLRWDAVGLIIIVQDLGLAIDCDALPRNRLETRGPSSGTTKSDTELL